MMSRGTGVGAVTAGRHRAGGKRPRGRAGPGIDSGLWGCFRASPGLLAGHTRARARADSRHGLRDTHCDGVAEPAARIASSRDRHARAPARACPRTDAGDGVVYWEMPMGICRAEGSAGPRSGLRGDHLISDVAGATRGELCRRWGWVWVPGSCALVGDPSDGSRIGAPRNVSAVAGCWSAGEHSDAPAPFGRARSPRVPRETGPLDSERRPPARVFHVKHLPTAAFGTGQPPMRAPLQAP